ncbi:MAG TPA: pyruvate kinase, partial [Ignavibacteriaceae bacterium]|nr:pyruvate kinase [Ignavibacteriaceae bacterium]
MKANLNDIFAKTKILCTLGPATAAADMIRKLVLSGVDGVRLNFSHGSYEFFENVLGNIHEVCTEEKTPLAILVDLQGPKIRIGELVQPELELETGNDIEITIENVKGTEKCI